MTKFNIGDMVVTKSMIIHSLGHEGSGLAPSRIEGIETNYKGTSYWVGQRSKVLIKEDALVLENDVQTFALGYAAMVFEKAKTITCESPDGNSTAAPLSYTHSEKGGKAYEPPKDNLV